SYLLELIEELRDASAEQEPSTLTEWQIYKLIVDRLMLRDLQRSPALAPEDRRDSLQKLALTLSRKEVAAANEEVFAEIINDNFKASLRRLSPEEKRAKQDELFQDLRSSATLTRTEAGGRSGWIFSHNSLREFLVAELCVGALVKGAGLDAAFPITSPMRSFVASAPPEIAKGFINALQGNWAKRQISNLGLYLSLGVDLLSAQEGGFAKALHKVASKQAGGALDFEGIALKDMDLSAVSLDRKKLLIHAKDSSLMEVSLKGLDLASSDFSASVLDRVSFTDCQLGGCSFASAIVFECDLSNSSVAGADFTGLDAASNFMVKVSGDAVVLAGPAAIGWLRFNGATTDAVPAYVELQHHPKFAIVLKICENISDQKNSQIRGLTQRGSAQSDTAFAKEFLTHLRNSEIITIVRNELVTTTSEGRKKLTRFVDHKDMPTEIESFLRGRV
ncbi:MAG TPA: pentapeptide repeat-containing protein, partial [Arenimonas sp.]|uniref:pentapeptide repeat-containing protein n=1 Tax=Arenimonas sp. TaxID=1872635 RepID=UPI002D7FCC1B